MLKEMDMQGDVPKILNGVSLAMIFEEPFTRTRVFFETAMTDLGGHALYLKPGEIHFGSHEAIRDTARVISSMTHGIMLRAKEHEELVALAECATLGLHYTVCSPKKYSMSEQEQAKIRKKMEESGGTLVVIDDVDEAIKDADFIVPDVWTYYGYEDEEEDRMASFMPKYQLNMDMLNRAPKHCKALHCLPANREVEIKSEVLDHPTRSLVFQEAENRLHTQRGLLAWFLYPRLREANEKLIAYNEGKLRCFLDTRLK